MILLEKKYFGSYKIKDFSGETIMNIEFIQSKTGHRSKQKGELEQTAVPWSGELAALTAAGQRGSCGNIHMATFSSLIKTISSQCWLLRRADCFGKTLNFKYN